MVLILLIKTYQLVLSPWLPNACRFHPTCSQYGIEAINKHGVFTGVYLLTKRLLKCHPWGGHGLDPVP